jgi:uncharacterized protein (DUF3820 family)
MEMPFGKHKGEQVHKLPKDYLGWLLNNATLRPYLKMEICQVLGVSYNHLAELQDTIERLRAENESLQTERDSLKVRTVEMGLMDEDLTRALRQFALKWHPDRGGSRDKMAAANDIFESLRATLSQKSCG